ncbi:hypothetical beta-1,6-N-acetylglucosaminyltransferase [Scheffersomyces stipitis CBS 6054]|uniref:Hypothetical beta-1,6-N-acetylglucosaminyltransferase n=1 Tax=Scheffersomyces stipitis (strain ATCC 58785 / CBS 6054 / NBRC 10063 / NRRL Y-11545) TaxID=322104 RepID=A3LXW5_PICST|nr:hypothetical beta-1,6-N-acetylglucosaminyltransferase [Scheffersomyces stipitis CBS 6054]ABN67874.2 hypothetical beta-1,6-N-acetylglucosaminyltransferase [Scheffersomyces stipitis CBS 6054]KAG2732153.1 hypothetical protein G9P44_004570 [Scheffersomyces stipitis]
MASSTSTTTQPKKRLSLFSFHSSSSSESKDNVAADSVAPDSKSVASVDDTISGKQAGSGSLAAVPVHGHEHEDHVHFNHELPAGLVDNPECQIFERSVQESCIFEPVLLNRQHSNSIVSSTSSAGKGPSSRSRSHTHNSITTFKPEDYIPPALDATTSLLNDKDANLDDVEMIYSNRRNSSVIGLNMALGRPISPSRKNSVYSMHNQSHMASPMLSVNTEPSAHITQIHSPVSPTKLSTSKSSLSFYSFADMINADEFARRPSFKSSYSQGIIPTSNTYNSVPPTFNRNPSFAKHRNPSTSSQLSSQLSSKDKVLKRIGSKKAGSSSTANNLNKFLISPESSDSEDPERDTEHDRDYTSSKPIKSVSKSPTTTSPHNGPVSHVPQTGANRKSVSSASSSTSGFIPPLASTAVFNDNESLISTSIGDCLRQTTTEINGQ